MSDEGGQSREGGLAQRQAAGLHTVEEEEDLEVDETPHVGPVSMRTRSSSITGVHEVRMSSGVLTDPQSIAEYERAFPGGGQAVLDGFLKAAAAEAAHRQECEKQLLANERENERQTALQAMRAQISALVAVLCGLTLAGYIAHLGHSEVALLIVSATFGSAAGVFVYGRKKQTEEAVADLQRQTAPPPPAKTASTAKTPAPSSPPADSPKLPPKS